MFQEKNNINRSGYIKKHINSQWLDKDVVTYNVFVEIYIFTSKIWIIYLYFYIFLILKYN